MATLNGSYFKDLNKDSKLKELMIIADKIATKYYVSNSYLGIEKEDFCQELYIVVWKLLEADDSQSLGWYVKSMYNRAVDIFRKYKNKYEKEIYLKVLPIDLDRSEPEDEWWNVISVNSDDNSISNVPTSINTKDEILIDILIDSYLTSLEDDILTLKYVLIKLKMNGYEFDSKYDEIIKDVKIDELESEYDVVLALGHYKSPKSGSWYGKKDKIRLILKELMEN